MVFIKVVRKNLFSNYDFGGGMCEFEFDILDCIFYNEEICLIYDGNDLLKDVILDVCVIVYLLIKIDMFCVMDGLEFVVIEM